MVASGVIDVTGSASRPRSSRPTVTARQWQHAHGQAAVDWMRSSGVAQWMLADICAAVETTVEWVVGDDSARARRVIEQYPEVLKHCDDLQFDDPAQALAYLILHVPDRYCRMFQVLERLLLNSRLPLGRSGNFAAIDIGAGPGPGIFAIRSFYAALACYVRLHDPSWRVATLGYTHVVERSEAMPWIMHRFAEALIVAEQGSIHGDDDRRREAVGFQNSATNPDLGVYAARSYSLMRPPRTGRRWIRSWERSAGGWSGRGGRSWRLR